MAPETYLSSRSSSSFQDLSTDCAICLCTLDEGEVIELSCGHKWHLECLKDQLEHAQPSTSQRLFFTGCQCAKCGTFCDHPKLEHLTRKTDALRGQVDALIADQLQVDVPNLWNQSSAGRAALMDQGRRTYAFYLCSCCEEPYFGGTIECADGLAGPRQQETGGPPERRLCAACTPQTVCRKPLQHRGQLIWKCRYCCQPSQYVCYGSVHFCQSCHDRNSQRLKETQRQQHNRQARSSDPPSLEPIPCPGGEACTFPKPAGHERHKNGPSPDCEQVYECACCASKMSADSHTEEPGSTNLLVNPNGAMGLQGWQQLNPQMPWRVEHSEIPVSDQVSTNFVSSFQWCVMAQRIPLHELVRDPSAIRIQVSAKYMGRTDCPSVFCLQAVVLGNGQQAPIHRQSTPVLEAPADSWEQAFITVGPTPGAHEIAIILHGKDSRFWQGNFGSKVADCCVRILGTPEELDQVWIRGDPGATAPQNSRGIDGLQG